jgi:hypothetical protein
LKEGDVIVKKWNPQTEELEDETDKDKIEAYVQGNIIFVLSPSKLSP